LDFITVLSKKVDEKYLKMYSVLKGHCITTHRNAVGYEIQDNIALKGQWLGLRRNVMHCPFRAKIKKRIKNVTEKNENRNWLPLLTELTKFSKLTNND
jgi:hypothetical protein